MNKTFAIQADLNYTTELARIDATEFDTAVFRFQLTEGTSTTAAIQLPTAFGDSDIPSGTTAISLSADTTVDIRDTAFIVPTVTTADSGKRGILYIYLRKSLSIDGGGA